MARFWRHYPLDDELDGFQLDNDYYNHQKTNNHRHPNNRHDDDLSFQEPQNDSLMMFASKKANHTWGSFLDNYSNHLPPRQQAHHHHHHHQRHHHPRPSSPYGGPLPPPPHHHPHPLLRRDGDVKDDEKRPLSSSSQRVYSQHHINGDGDMMSGYSNSNSNSSELYHDHDNDNSEPNNPRVLSLSRLLFPPPHVISLSRAVAQTLTPNTISNLQTHTHDDDDDDEDDDDGHMENNYNESITSNESDSSAANHNDDDEEEDDDVTLECLDNSSSLIFSFDGDSQFIPKRRPRSTTSTSAASTDSEATTVKKCNFLIEETVPLSPPPPPPLCRRDGGGDAIDTGSRRRTLKIRGGEFMKDDQENDGDVDADDDDDDDEPDSKRVNRVPHPHLQAVSNASSHKEKLDKNHALHKLDCYDNRQQHSHLHPCPHHHQHHQHHHHHVHRRHATDKPAMTRSLPRAIPTINSNKSPTYPKLKNKIKTTRSSNHVNDRSTGASRESSHRRLFRSASESCALVMGLKASDYDRYAVHDEGSTGIHSVTGGVFHLEL